MSEAKRKTIDEATMFTIKDVAELLQCSDRHIKNLRDRGEIPQPVKSGAKVLWPPRRILKWIESGCPALAV